MPTCFRARPSVQAARINLDYTKVTSPVAGRIGISQVTEGAYVQASAATLLATVQQLDPVYVLDVTQASSEVTPVEARTGERHAQSGRHGGERG